MKPNHHYSVHFKDQLKDFGMVYNMWAFLPERLNKLLKGYNSNNSAGGQLEVTMMRSFMRSVYLDNMVTSLYFFSTAILTHNAFSCYLLQRLPSLHNLTNLPMYYATHPILLVGPSRSKPKNAHVCCVPALPAIILTTQVTGFRTSCVSTSSASSQVENLLPASGRFLKQYYLEHNVPVYSPLDRNVAPNSIPLLQTIIALSVR